MLCMDVQFLPGPRVWMQQIEQIDLMCHVTTYLMHTVARIVLEQARYLLMGCIRQRLSLKLTPGLLKAISMLRVRSTPWAIRMLDPHI